MLYMAPQDFENDNEREIDHIVSKSMYLGSAFHTFTLQFLQILKQESDAGVVDKPLSIKTLTISKVTKKTAAQESQIISESNLGQLVIHFQLIINNLEE